MNNTIGDARLLIVRALMIQSGLQLSRSRREPRHLAVAPFVYLPASSMTAAHWVRTNETEANGRDPVSHRAFLDTITSPYGKVTVCGKTVIGVDNNHTLFVNGDNIDHGGNWRPMENPNLNPNVIAVDEENTPSVLSVGEWNLYTAVGRAVWTVTIAVGKTARRRSFGPTSPFAPPS
ncbi:hypothetical protein F5146DRAFT_1005572 [Armillaria mellea]|nr:hypothetical protein F5146DRAFT_1005572 [Armillaria mellea]